MAVGGRRGASSRLHVLGWHNVESTWRFPSEPGDGAAGLERQFRALSRFANVVPLEEALHDLREHRPLPPRAVAITFDDGYRDNLTVAVPLLDRLGLPATIFLVPGFLFGKSHAWWERLGWAFSRARSPVVTLRGRRMDLGPHAGDLPLVEAEHVAKSLNESARAVFVDDMVDQLDPVGEDPTDDLFMDWDDARELVRSGITVGSHTMSHRVLAHENDTAVRAELTDSRAALRDELGVPIDTLAYPNGQRHDYDPRVIAAARSAGYSQAVVGWGLVNAADTHRYEVRRKLVAPMIPPTRLLLGMVRDSIGGA